MSDPTRSLTRIGLHIRAQLGERFGSWAGHNCLEIVVLEKPPRDYGRIVVVDPIPVDVLTDGICSAPRFHYFRIGARVDTAVPDGRGISPVGGAGNKQVGGFSHTDQLDSDTMSEDPGPFCPCSVSVPAARLHTACPHMTAQSHAFGSPGGLVLDNDAHGCVAC